MNSALTGCRIGLLTASASRLGGGVFEAVVAQAGLIRSLGGTVHVFALEDTFSEQDRERFGNATVQHAPVVGPRQIGFAPTLAKLLDDAALDCLHLHGIWMYPSAAAARWMSRNKRPGIISPHGMLDPWITARGRWKKVIARAVYERRSWRQTTLLHALTRREAGDISRETYRPDCLVIPNAGPSLTPERAPIDRPQMILYVGRIHTKKNLIALVKGWHGAARPSDARLVIAGWGDASETRALEQAVSQGDGSATFVGPIYGEDKAALLREASWVVLPSHSEGLPMAILEAWAGRLPVLMTQECNLPEGFEAGAAMDCGYDVQSIGKAIERALSLPRDDWERMSCAAADLAEGAFSPQQVAGQWAAAYLRAIKGADPR